MNRKARYICLEGTEGVGKTTQTKKLVDSLRARGFRVLQTKEPGTDHIPLTMALRGIMLDNQYDAVLTRPAREFVSQAIRSIHLERLIVPSMHEYDFIIQDRGVLSGLAYGIACGNDPDFLIDLAYSVVPDQIQLVNAKLLYDKVIYLTGNVENGLTKALSAKQEFETGDAMESRGNEFIKNVAKNMDQMSSKFNTVRIEVDGKSIDEVHTEILSTLDLTSKEYL